MFRSLHMKLVLILVLLIMSLMLVVGVFLMNAVVRFYLDDFNQRMSGMFSSENREFYEDLTEPYEGEENGVEGLEDVLRANMGELGVDGRTRNYFILDAATGPIWPAPTTSWGRASTRAATSSAPSAPGSPPPAATSPPTIWTWPSPSPGETSPISSRSTTTARAPTQLNSALFMIIVQSLVFGLVSSVLLSFLLAKTMITPIERLTDGARRVAAGDFSRKLEVGSKDEIGILTATFNSMARQLQSTIREVENERNKLDTLFLHMTDGVVAFSREGAVIQKNPAAEDMLGRPIGEGATYADLFADAAPLSEVLALEQPAYLDRERTAGRRSLELLMAPFDQERDEGGVLVVIHDVTTQRRNEEMRREFVANVSHELRTPLTNIRSYAETLVDGAGDIPLDMEKNFLGVILNESDRMTHIVQDLLTLSRFDSGRSELKLERFSFRASVRDIYNAVLMDAQRHGHHLELDLPEDLPDIVGDRDRILQ